MDNLGILVQAILSLKDTKASKDQIVDDLPALEHKLQSDKGARVKIIAKLDVDKSKAVIQSQLNTLTNQAKAPTIKIGVDTGGFNSTLSDVQNKIIATNNGLSIKPTVDGKVIEDTGILIKKIVSKLQTINTVDLKAFKDNLKNTLGVSSKEITADADKLIQTLKLNPEDTNSIIQSYEHLMDSIRNTLISMGRDKITDGASFENNLVTSIYKAATSFKEVQTQAQQTATSVVSSMQQMQTQAEQTGSAMNSAFGVNHFGKNASEYVHSQQTIRRTFDDTVNVVKEAEAEFKQFGQVSVNSVEHLGANGALKNFTINVKSATGEVEKFKYIAKNIGDNQNPVKIFELQDVEAANAGIQRLIDSQKKYQSQVEATATSLKAQLNTIQSGYTDKNGAKYISNTSNQTALANQYKVVKSAIEKLKTADQTTFASMKANAEAEITTLKNMVKQFQNAEYAATSLRTKGVSTTKRIETDNLDNFINKINASNVPFENLRRHIDVLKGSLANITNTESLTKYLNYFSRVEAKFNSLKSLYQGIGGYDKQLDNLAKSWQKQGIYVGNVQTIVENLKKSLANVTTADGLTAWVNDFKNQIGAISQLPIKIAEYRNQLNGVKQIWADFQGKDKIISNINKEFGKLGSRLGSIKTESGLAKWSKDLAKVNSQVIGLITNLNRQVEVQNSINNTQAQIAKLNPTKDNAEIARLNEKLSAEQQILSGLKTQSNVYNNLISYEQQEQYITEQTLKAREKLLSATNTGVKQYQASITTAISDLQGILNSTTFTKNASNSQVTQTKQDINSLITAYQNLMTKLQGNITPAGLETIRTELAQLNARFNTTTATAKQFETELRNDNGAEKLAQRVALLRAQIEAYAKANPKAMKKFGDTFNSMIATLNSSPDKMNVDRVAKEFQTVRQEINKADLAGKTFFQNLKDKINKFTGWMSMTYAVSLVTRTIRSMITEVVNLDTALIDLKKTFKGTNSDLQDFYYEANNIAKQLGVTTEEVINSASSWSRLGYNTKQTAVEMAKAASIMKMISPNMDIDTANSGLVSIVKAFDEIDVGNIMNEVISPINEVGNNFAVSNNDILEGLQRSSAAMKMMGEDLTSTIALFTAGKFCCLYVQKCA